MCSWITIWGYLHQHHLFSISFVFLDKKYFLDLFCQVILIYILIQEHILFGKIMVTQIQPLLQQQFSLYCSLRWILFIDQLLKAFIGPAFASVIVTVGWSLFIMLLVMIATFLSRPALVLSLLFILMRRELFINIEAVIDLCVIPLVGAGMSRFLSSAEFQGAVPHPIAKIDQHTCRAKR